MKKLFLGAVVMFFSFSVYGEISFDQLAQITGMPDKHSGSFVQQKYIHEVNASVESSGVFEYERGKAIRWEILEPIQTELVMTPTQIKSKQDGEELLKLDTSTNPTVAALSEIFFAIITADWKILETYVELSGSIDGDRWHAVLVPLDQAARLTFSRVELSGGRVLEKVVVHEGTGDRTTIDFQ